MTMEEGEENWLVGQYIRRKSDGKRAGRAASHKGGMYTARFYDWTDSIDGEVLESDLPYVLSLDEKSTSMFIIGTWKMRWPEELE